MYAKEAVVIFRTVRTDICRKSQRVGGNSGV